MFTKKTFVAASAATLIGILGFASIADAKVTHPNYAKGSKAYGYVVEGVPASPGNSVNGNFIPRGTSPAQIPARHQEDDYGSGAGK